MRHLLSTHCLTSAHTLYLNSLSIFNTCHFSQSTFTTHTFSTHGLPSIQTPRIASRMAAAEQVLELHQIYTLKRVSKFWNQLIISSPAIRKATCLQPSGYDAYGTPGYSTPSTVNVHLSIGGSFRFTRETPTYTRFYINSSSQKAMQKFRDEFATMPRCQALLVQAYHSVKNRDFISCVLYVKDGVKIADLLDLRDGMKTTFARYDLRGGESEGLDCKVRIQVTFTTQS